MIQAKYCHNPNDTTKQPQHCSWAGHENDSANPTTHLRPQKLNGGLWETQINIPTKSKGINNNNINNNNKDNNNINNYNNKINNNNSSLKKW